jgi:glutathione S-transferase
VAICLYDNAGSVAAQKVRIVLAEKGLTFDRIPIDLRNGEVMSPEYLRLNPEGVVPTLRHEGVVLVESSLINEYLDEAFPLPALRPQDPVGRHTMRLWVRRADEQAHRAIGSLSQAIYIRHAHLKKTEAELDRHFARMPDRERATRQRTVIQFGLDAPQVADALQTYRRLIDRIDEALIDRDWLAGPSFSLADIAWAPYIARLDMLSLSPLWTEGRRPHLARWWAAVQSRDSYRQEVDQAIASETRALMAERGREAWPRLAQLLNFG